MWLLIPTLLTIHILVCGLLVFVVLMQLPRSEGLGAAFGGNVTENIFGAQTTNVLARATVWLGISFFVITLLLAVAYAHKNAGHSAEKDKLMSTALVAPAATPAASPAAALPVASPSATPVASPSVAPAASPAASPVNP